MERYQQSYEVKSYECDDRGNLRLRILFNYFQDMADEHASILGVGREMCKEKNMVWVGSGYHIRVMRLPKWQEVLQIKTWPAAKTRVTAKRDFCVTDDAGASVVAATSQWALLDGKTMRPVALDKSIPSYVPVGEDVLDSDFRVTETPSHIDYTVTFPVRMDDLDVNRHVNNAVYPTWVLDALPPHWLDSHTLFELKIAYKKSAVYGDTVTVNTEVKDSQTVHQIISATDGTEFARVIIDLNS